MIIQSFFFDINSYTKFNDFIHKIPCSKITSFGLIIIQLTYKTHKLFLLLPCLSWWVTAAQSTHEWYWYQLKKYEAQQGPFYLRGVNLHDSNKNELPFVELRDRVGPRWWESHWFIWNGKTFLKWSNFYKDPVYVIQWFGGSSPVASNQLIYLWTRVLLCIRLTISRNVKVLRWLDP